MSSAQDKTDALDEDQASRRSLGRGSLSSGESSSLRSVGSELSRVVQLRRLAGYADGACFPRKPRLGASRPKAAPPHECRSPAERMWPQPARLIRKRAVAGSAAPRLSRSGPRGRRAHAGFIGADVEGRVVDPPHARRESGASRRLMVRSMHAGTSGTSTPSQRRRHAARRRRRGVRRSVPPSRGVGVCI
jgi:hypothetical protein